MSHGLREIDRLETEPQIASTDPSGGQHLVDDARYRGSRHRQLELARQAGGHQAGDLAGGVHQRSARKAWIEHQVDAQESVYLATSPRAPRAADRAHHAPAGP